MADILLDTERRVELASLELLKAWTLLTALTTADRVRVAMNKSAKADYPAGCIEAVLFREFGRQTGWYQGNLRLIAQTYEADDKDRVIAKKISGALRGWAQQETLVAQLNATTSATTTGTKVDFEWIQLDGAPYESDAIERVNELVVEVQMLARPSITT